MPNPKYKVTLVPKSTKCSGRHSYGKKIEDEERRERFRKILEKRRAKSTEDPKDIPNNAENGNEATENSKK